MKKGRKSKPRARSSAPGISSVRVGSNKPAGIPRVDASALLQPQLPVLPDLMAPPPLTAEPSVEIPPWRPRSPAPMPRMAAAAVTDIGRVSLPKFVTYEDASRDLAASLAKEKAPARPRARKHK